THKEIFLAVALLRALDDATVVDRDLAGADNLELLALDDDGRALVDPDAEDVRVPGDDLLQIVLTVAGQHMLIDRHAFYQTEPLLVARRHHDVVVLVRAAHHVGRQDRGARRRTCDHASALEHLLHLALGARVRVP